MTEKSADAFRTISEVAGWLGVQTHVLRFWESRFPQIAPVKRAGGRRYYRPGDMEIVGGIKVLLHDNGMTIRGVQKILREQGVQAVTKFAPPLDGTEGESPMAIDVMPADNVVALKPKKKKKPAEAPAAERDSAQDQATLPLSDEASAANEDDVDDFGDAGPEDHATEDAPESASGTAGDDDAAGTSANARLVALRERLAALRDRSADSS